MKAQVTILLLLIATSCSLEAARQRRINSAPTEARSAVPRQVTQCEAWDTFHVWGDWTAGVSAGVGTVAAGLASQTEGKTADVATGVVIGAGIVSAGALVFATQSEKSWAEKCGQ
jgi:hypothetical protein